MNPQEILISLMRLPCSSGDVFKDCKIIRGMEAEGLVSCEVAKYGLNSGEENPVCDEGKPLLWVEITKLGYNFVVKNNPGITGYYGDELTEWKL